jgi:hypothetical protein
VGSASTLKANTIPTAMLRKANHSIELPIHAATPPNPTIAAVEMNVEP